MLLHNCPLLCNDQQLGLFSFAEHRSLCHVVAVSLISRSRSG